MSTLHVEATLGLIRLPGKKENHVVTLWLFTTLVNLSIKTPG
jgi:hypothetical protein